MKIKSSIVACSLLLALPLIANETNTTQTKETNNTKAQITQNEDKVLAIVNGQKIMESYFDESFQNVPSEHKIKILERVITSELLVQFSQKHKLFNDQSILKKIDTVEKEYQATNRKFTSQDRRMIHGLTVIKHLAKQYASSKIDQNEIQKYYNTNINKLKKINYITAYDLIVSSKKEALQILQTLSESNQNKSKEKFLNLSKQYKGIKLVEISKLYMFGLRHTPINKEIFSLKNHEFSSEPIYLKDGYHILYRDTQEASQQVPSLSELEDNIKVVLTNVYTDKWIKEKYTQLKNDAKIIKYLK